MTHICEPANIILVDIKQNQNDPRLAYGATQGASQAAQSQDCQGSSLSSGLSGDINTLRSLARSLSGPNTSPKTLLILAATATPADDTDPSLVRELSNKLGCDNDANSVLGTALEALSGLEYRPLRAGDRYVMAGDGRIAVGTENDAVRRQVRLVVGEELDSPLADTYGASVSFRAPKKGEWIVMPSGYISKAGGDYTHTARRVVFGFNKPEFSWDPTEPVEPDNTGDKLRAKYGHTVQFRAPRKDEWIVDDGFGNITRASWDYDPSSIRVVFASRPTIFSDDPAPSVPITTGAYAREFEYRTPREGEYYVTDSGTTQIASLYVPGSERLVYKNAALGSLYERRFRPATTTGTSPRGIHTTLFAGTPFRWSPEKPSVAATDTWSRIKKLYGSLVDFREPVSGEVFVSTATGGTQIERDSGRGNRLVIGSAK